MRILNGLCAVILLALATIAPAAAQDAEVALIDTPRGVKQRFLVIAPQDPVASVILFTGGNGLLGIQSPTEIKSGENSFLVRSRDKLAANKLMIAVMDGPSDRPDGMDGSFRIGNAHAGDIGAVAAYLKRLADVPVWLVGTSMGTFSAAWGAIAADNVDGLVLTSTVTRVRPKWKLAQTHADGVASLELEDVTVPTLIVSHAQDACDLSPADGTEKLKKRLGNAKTVDVVVLKGGEAGESQQPCGSMSPHGFLGVEADAVDAIAKFIKANSAAAEPDKQ
jgi:hypothetical protein